MAGYCLYSLDAERLQRLIDQPTDAELDQLAEALHESIERQAEWYEESDPVLRQGLSTVERKELVRQQLARADWYGHLTWAGKNIWEGVIWTLCMERLEPPIDVGFRCESDGIYWDVVEEIWRLLQVVPHQVCDVAMSSFGTEPLRCRQPRSATPQTRAEFDGERADKAGQLRGMQAALDEFKDDLLSGDMSVDEMSALLKQRGLGKAAELFDALTSDDDDEQAPDPPNDAKVADEPEFKSMHSMHLPEQVTRMRQELESLAPILSEHEDEEIRREFVAELLPTVTRVAREGRVLFIQVDT